MADHESRIHDTLNQLLDAFNRHDLDAIMDLFAEDATLAMPRGPHPWGSSSSGRPRCAKVSLVGSRVYRTFTTGMPGTL